MGLLERLRPQPKWRHADAAVRAAGIAEIPVEEIGTVSELAREDPDPRVRRACVDRLEDPRLLAEIARGDADEGVREAATRALVDTAIGEYDGATEPASAAALEGLADGKSLAEIAKRSAFEPVSRAAAARITDQKTLASVARRAVHVATRMEALARVTAADDLDAIAVRTDFKDVALAALERIEGRERLDAIAERAKNKAAARAAKGRVREIEEADRAREADAAARAAEARTAATSVIARAETLPAERDADRLRAALSDVDREWSALPPVDSALQSRYERAKEQGQRALAEAEHMQAVKRDQDAAMATSVAARTHLCERIEALDESATRDQLDELQAMWAALPPMAGADPAQLESRFARASKTVVDRWERAENRHAHRARLEALLVEAEELGLTDVDPQAPDSTRAPLAARVARFKDIRRDWLAAAPHVDADLAERFQTLQAGIDAARTRAREAREAREREQIDRLRRDVERLERQAAVQPLALKQADRTLRDVRAALDQHAAGRSAAPSKEHADLVARLRALQTALTPKVTELRELDDWQRWANVEVQEKLCARVEALKDVADVEAIARELRVIQEEWRGAASVPRQHAQALWHRYKTAYDAAHERCEAFFAQQNEARADNLRRKEELCARAESLAESHDWVATAEVLKGLQGEWKSIGPVPRGHEKAIWDRFQKACDRFFTRRHEDLARRKEMWSQNLARKEALCVRAESLAESTDWDATAAAFKALQSEWKTIGPVKKSRSEAVWHRFRAACDRFFDRYKHRHQAELQTRMESREQLLTELETLAGSAESENVGPAVAAIYTKWLHAPPLPREHAAAAQERFSTALDRLITDRPAAFAGTPLDANANRRRLEQLTERVEKLVPSEQQRPDESAASPTARLATMLRDALAANTIGGRVDEEAKWRAAIEDVRDAQAAWSRVGYVADGVRRPLQQRFERASRRIMDQASARRGAPARR